MNVKIQGNTLYDVKMYELQRMKIVYASESAAQNVYNVQF